MTEGSKLDLGHLKKNVFVTQLHQRDEDDEDLQKFPIVKDAAGHLLETGLNTLQSTLVLKKESELARVDKELMEKRKEFQQRMEACAERKLTLQARQQAMKDRVARFDKFIQENEAKRRRAMQKYQVESRLKELKTKEYSDVCMEYESIKARHKMLLNKVKSFKKFETYLMQVVDILPPDYIKMADNTLVGLMMRHKTLHDTNITLQDDMGAKSDELKNLRTELATVKAEHTKQVLSMNSQLSQLHDLQERKKEEIEQIEQKFRFQHTDLRNQVENFGMVLRAIDNITEKCLKRYDPALKDMNTDMKLEKIKAMPPERKMAKVKEYLVDITEIIRMIEEEIANSKRKGKGVTFTENQGHL